MHKVNRSEFPAVWDRMARWEVAERRLAAARDAAVGRRRLTNVEEYLRSDETTDGQVWS